jgi:hypothetical protein
MAYEKDQDEIGALWERQTAKGDTYMTGEILGQKVVIFAAHSKHPKGPAWRVLKSKPREDARPSRVSDPDDIPFGE